MTHTLASVKLLSIFYPAIMWDYILGRLFLFLHIIYCMICIWMVKKCRCFPKCGIHLIALVTNFELQTLKLENRLKKGRRGSKSHSMARANLNKSKKVLTSTTTASKYIPKRPRICINWNPPSQTQIYLVKVPLNVNIVK